MMGDLLESIAIVGMALRFPGAASAGEFWDNLRNGIESITFMSEGDCDSFRIPVDRRSNNRFVPAEGILKEGSAFDPDTFDLTASQASLTDPQQRLFLQCASEVMRETASTATNARTGVFAGYSPLGHTISTWPLVPVRQSYGDPDSRFGAIFTSLANLVSYKLNLTGPSIDILAGSPASLAAVYLACQSLLNGEVDFSIAGGVSYKDPSQRGYIYVEGDVFSPDGHCRAFDERASGIVPGTGAGCVGLMRLSDALAGGCPIHALIISTALNNDGSMKVGYTAPSLQGQTAVITQALGFAGVEPESIGYVEAHGTGTLLGDPIEVVALARALASSNGKEHLCGLGSVKTNIGHLDAAAGIAGLIKVVLALKNKMLPATLNFEKPNRRINWEDSPFFITAAASEWISRRTPRRAGLNSFGIGGTNVHVILEEFTSLKAAENRSDSRMATKDLRAFISYVRQDGPLVDRLCKDLAAQGIAVWRDQDDIPPGKRWKQEIAKAIRTGGFFIACFSQRYYQRESTYMNEELVLAIEELRKRPTDRAWFLPVLLSDCEIPTRVIGAGETLQDLQAVPLFRDWEEGLRRIVLAIKAH